MAEPRDWWRAAGAAAVAVLAVAALAARFVTTSPLWLDEALSVHIADLPLGAIADALRRDGHPPLYYWLLHGWMGIVGEGDVAVRTLSGIAGVAALPLAWWSGARVGGPRVAWAAVLLLGLSPYAVRYATETRMYALVTLLVFAGHLVVRRAVDERRASPASLVAVAGLTGSLLLTQYWSFFVLASTAVVLVWWGRRHGAAARRVAGRLVAAMGAGTLLFVPWVPGFLDQAAHTGTPWATAARPSIVLDTTLRDFGGGTLAEGGLLAALLVVLLLLGVTGRSTPSGLVLDHRPVPGIAGEASVAALTLALGSAAAIATATTYASRYASVILPLVVLVAARGLSVVPGRRAPLVMAGAAVLLGGVAIVDNIRSERTQAGQLAEAIAAGRGDGGADVVITCPDQLGPALRRSLDAEGLAGVPLLVYPTLGDGRRVDWFDYEERNDAADPAVVAAEVLDRIPVPDARLWVAWSGSYRTFEGDCEAFLNALAAARGGFRTVVAEQGDAFFEHAALVVFG